MKVLTVQNIEGVAGSENYFLALLPALMKQGVDCAVYCVYKKENLANAQLFFDLLKAEQIPFYLQEVKSYASPSIPKKINRIYKQDEFDIIHTHLIYADFWGALIKSFFNKLAIVISTKHGYHESTYVKYCNQPEKLPVNLYYRLFKYTHKRMDRSYACSHGLVDFYERGGLIKKGSMDVIQHGFDYPEVEAFDEQLYRFSSHQLIVVGRLIERKGHHFLFTIIPELVQSYPDLQVVLLGDGELQEELKRMAQDLRIEKHIQFIGFKKEVLTYLAASDIAVVPSYSEGLPLVIFEAFKAKVPVVTFDVIGCNELVQDGSTGLIVKAFDTNELKIKISSLLASPEERKRLSDNASKELDNHFCLKRMTLDTLNYYETTLALASSSI